MTDKEKQIKELAHSLCCWHQDVCSDCGAPCAYWEKANRLYAVGYRKQSEVAESIIVMLKAAKPVVKTHFEAYDELFENIAAEYGVEVEG